MIKILIPLLSILFVTACTSIRVDTYHSTGDNVRAFKELGVKFNVVNFSADDEYFDFLCRGSNYIVMPSREPAEKYIQDAFIEELKVSGMYSESSELIIKGNLNKIEEDDFGSDAHWLIEMTIENTAGESVVVSHKRNYVVGSYHGTACKQDMPKAFTSTVKGLIQEAVTNPQFIQMYKAKI